jgi:enoyl-CoA hydratase
VVSTVEYDVQDSVALVRINRPERLNALNRQVEQDVDAALGAMDARPDVRVVILTGAGKAFSVGADIDELATTPESAARQLRDTLAFLSSPERLQKPVIAAVNGYAFGGGLELAIACDVIVASERATFAVPEPTLGVVPGFAMQRLPGLIGVARAREILLTARRLTAAEAQQYGLVARVVPHDSLIDEARTLAAGMAALAPGALALLKASINRNFSTQDLLFAERANAWLFATADAAEGRAAFREKRKAKFSGSS